MRTTFPVLISSIIFLACNNQQTFSISFSKSTIAAGYGQTPFLTKDPGGQLFLSWTEMSGDSTNQFCYTGFQNERFFEDIIKVPGSENILPHGENIPKIIFDKRGDIFAFWGIANPSPKNKYYGKILYSASQNNGQTWNLPGSISSDTSSIDQRYFDLLLMPQGDVAAVWLDNRKSIPGEGSALFMAVAGNDKRLQNETRIAEPCCPCCRTDFFLDSKENLHVVYRGIWQDSIRDMMHIVSSNLGKSFSTPQRIHEDNWVIDGCPHTGPAISEAGNDIQFAWFTGAGDGGVFYTNTSMQAKKAMPALLHANGSHPQMATNQNGLVAIVWDEADSHHNANKKRIAIEIKNAQGESIGKEYLPTNNEFAGFPVIQAYKDGFVIAYTIGKGRTSTIAWQRIFVRN